MSGYRIRTRIEVVRDILAACRRMGELGLAAELGMREPDATTLDTTLVGLRHLLTELRLPREEQ